MTEQSTALRLADLLDAHQFDEPHAAAAELRRLEIQRDALLEALKFYENAGSELSRLVAQRDLLVRVLKDCEIALRTVAKDDDEFVLARHQIREVRAALKAVEE